MCTSRQSQELAPGYAAQHETKITDYRRAGDETQYKATCSCGWVSRWWRDASAEAEHDATDHRVRTHLQMPVNAAGEG